MLVVQIDGVDAQPLQTRLAGAAHVVQLAADRHEISAGVADVGELGRQEYAVALAFQPSSSNFSLV